VEKGKGGWIFLHATASTNPWAYSDIRLCNSNYGPSFSNNATNGLLIRESPMCL
jgi:hypothetical protein